MNIFKTTFQPLQWHTQANFAVDGVTLHWEPNVTYSVNWHQRNNSSGGSKPTATHSSKLWPSHSRTRWCCFYFHGPKKMGSKTKCLVSAEIKKARRWHDHTRCIKAKDEKLDRKRSQSCPRNPNLVFTVSSMYSILVWLSKETVP